MPDAHDIWPEQKNVSIQVTISSKAFKKQSIASCVPREVK